MSESADVKPKTEKVEYWHLVSREGASTTYMLRTECGEKAQVLKNPIDNTPVEVQMVFKSCDDKNETVGFMFFPVPNLFSYGFEPGVFEVWPKGHSPADKALADVKKHQLDGLAARKLRFESIIGGIADLRDGPEPPATA
jgi:hypothetical protein